MTDPKFIPPKVGGEVWPDGTPRTTPTSPLDTRDAMTAQIAKAFDVPIGMVDPRVVDPESSPGPWHYRAAWRIARVRPIYFVRRHVRIYMDQRDLWIGVYVSPDAIYVCPLPCIVFRWQRRA
jgi:hypothetical protein